MPVDTKAARVIVSKVGNRRSRWWTTWGRSIAQYPATSGSEHDSAAPLANGRSRACSRILNSNYNPDLFWDASPKDTKATIGSRFPNNPVGRWVWIDISKRALRDSWDSIARGSIGHAESRTACIRLTNWDAMELAGMVGKGTPLSFYRISHAAPRRS